MANRWGNSGNSVRLYFGGLQNHCRWWLCHEIKRRLLLGRKVMTNLDSIFKSRDITLPTKVRLVKAMVFPVVMLDVRVGLWRRLSTEELMLLTCGVGEDSWESLGLQGDPTSPFWRDQPWDSFGGNDAEAETPVLRPPHAKSWLTGKDSNAGRDWGQEEKGTTEDEMAGWHHWLDGCWVWVNSSSWWWTGRPGVLHFTGSQRVGHDWVTELNWTEGERKYFQ